MDEELAVRAELEDLEELLEQQRLERQKKLKKPKRDVNASLGEGRNRMLPKARDGERV